VIGAGFELEIEVDLRVVDETGTDGQQASD